MAMAPTPDKDVTGEQDMSPIPAGASTPQASDAKPTDVTNEADMQPGASSGSGDASTGGDQSKQITDALQQHLDGLQQTDKAFLAAHLTPETVHAIGLINGPIVEQYLSQFADQSKVSVPVPRAIAEKMAQQYVQSKQGGQPQGQPQPAAQQNPAQALPAAPPGPPQAQPQAAPQMPQGGGMMSPQGQ